MLINGSLAFVSLNPTCHSPCRDFSKTLTTMALNQRSFGGLSLLLQAGFEGLPSSPLQLRGAQDRSTTADGHVNGRRVKLDDYADLVQESAMMMPNYRDLPLASIDKYLRSCPPRKGRVRRNFSAGKSDNGSQRSFANMEDSEIRMFPLIFFHPTNYTTWYCNPIWNGINSGSFSTSAAVSSRLFPHGHKIQEDVMPQRLTFKPREEVGAPFPG